jgi:hypothetical protein
VLSSLWGGNVSLPRSLYERAETFAPSVRIDYNEDLDLGLRLARVGAVARFDEHARAAHEHRRGIVAFLRECARRGEAIALLERRWGERPAQLTPMVEIPVGYRRALAHVQRRISARSDDGGWQRVLVGLYRAAGGAHAWRVQDAITRLLRRAVIMRGYREARARSAPDDRPCT